MKSFFTCCLFIFSLNAFAIELDEVANQFLNIHGPDWEKVAKTKEDFQEIRHWHEKIIENPDILKAPYPQPGMVDYLHPIAIHSYASLIGNKNISLDERSKEMLSELTLDSKIMNSQKMHAVVEAIALTSTPWASKTLRSLVNESNPKLNQIVLEQLSDIYNRFNPKGHEEEGLDHSLPYIKIDYDQNAKQWKDEIYETRKLVTNLAKKSPELLENTDFLKLSVHSNQANQKLSGVVLKTKNKKGPGFLKDLNQTVIKKEKHKENHKKNTRAVAGKKDKTTLKKDHSLFMAIMALVLLLLFFGYKKFKK